MSAQTGAWLHVQADVCKICPFSRRCKPGTYSTAEYDRIEAYDGTIQDQLRNDAVGIYYCHEDRDWICAGWIACFDSAQLVALNRRAEVVDWNQVCSFRTVTPVFRSGREAALHGRDIPPAGFAGLRKKLNSRRTVDVDALANEIVDAIVQWAGADPKLLDRAAKVLTYNPHLGELPSKDGVYRFRPRWCKTCDDCPQYRPQPKPGSAGSLCKCGCTVAEHSYQPREINIVKKGEAGDPAQNSRRSQADPVENNSGSGGAARPGAQPAPAGCP